MIERAEWLSDVVLVNESSAINAPGDVSLFRSVGDACGALEPWWVKNQEGFVLSANGEHLLLGVSDGRVVPVGRETIGDGKAIVERWLTAAASAVLTARTARAVRGGAVLSTSERLGALPTAVEGLIAYVGFET